MINATLVISCIFLFVLVKGVVIMNKKISFIIPSLSLGGIEVNTIRLAKAFYENGYLVDIVTVNSKNDYQEMIPNGIKIVNLNCRKLLLALPKIINYVKKEKPIALISASEGLNIITAMSKQFVKKIPTKIIISIRTHLSTEYKETNRKIKKIFPILSRILYPKVDVIVAVSRGVAQDIQNLLKIPIKNIHIIYNPIFDDSIEELSSQEIHHPIFKKSRDFKIVLGAGRLTKQKDFKTLIYAFNEVRKKMKCKLVIIGEGEERKNLEDLIKKLGIENDVYLLGFVPNPYPYMKEADVFVLSSIWEGFGNVLVEAMATGTNVVSTNCPSGPTEILDNGLYGDLVRVGDYKQLSNSIIKAIENPKSKETIISRAKKFSVTSAFNKYKQIIENT